MFALFYRGIAISGQLVLLLISCVFLVACDRYVVDGDDSRVPGVTLEPQPVQSPNDPLQYRLLRLDNQLQVLLISDPDSPRAAAALDVMVGSGDNPPGRGGLAHFLEHMLFLGTDKYPDAAEYERYITEHGGRRNAYTSFEHTNYFFDINAAYLPEALDRFAQFFIAPRFDAKYVEREKNAVQAEYQMGLKSDSRRGLDVLQEVMSKDHPYSQFAVGNLESLADRPGASIRDELIRFYEQHYSANVMRLVVLGNESLDELEALVAPMFSAIPNKSYVPTHFDQALIEASELPMLVKIEPQATQRQLQVSFLLADYRPVYRAKPLSYLGNLVGHEGEGSLLSQLKAEGLAESLAAGNGLGWRGGSMFSVTITLTEKGARDHQRVMQLLFAYLDMLREQGPKQWLYDEQARLAALNFQFKEKVNPMNYVSALASGMHYYAPQDVLQGPFIMEDFDAQMLGQLFQQLRPENALVVFNDKAVETDRISTYYQVPYSRQRIAGQQLGDWQSDQKAEELHLPGRNPFIAADVSLVKIAEDNPEYPEVRLDTKRQKIWFKQDEAFRVPRGATYINFRSPEVGQTASQAAAAILYTSLLKDQVNEFTYPALLAGLSFSVYKHAQGISLRVSGYDDKQAELLEKLLDRMVEAEFDPQRFVDVRANLVRSLHNSEAKRPSSQVIDDLREALLYGEWGEQALIDELEKIDRENLQTYVNRFWKGATAEVLVYGNYELRVVAELSDMLSKIVPQSPAPPLPGVRILRLGAGEAIQYRVSVSHDDSVVAWYLQGENNSWEDRAATALTAQIMKSGFFQQLRTEQQLGYVVSVFAWSQHDVPGLVMLVQSPVANAQQVAGAMKIFLTGVEGDLDEDQFKRHRKALVNEILRKDKNMWERAEFYWQSIARKQNDFDGRQALADAVKELSLESWQDYYRRVFLSRTHSLQVVTPGHWNAFPEVSGAVFDSADSIKAGHGIYVIH